MRNISNNAREDLLALTTHKPHWSRRDFIVGSMSSVVAGFALAVQPVCAQTIVHTEALNLTARMVQVPTDNGTIPAYYAMPSMMRNSRNGVAAAHACGEHEVGKGIGVSTSRRSSPLNSSGSRPCHDSDAARRPLATTRAASWKP